MSGAAPAEVITVASWNVHRGIGSDGVHDPRRTAAVIRETGAQILALQEVELLGSDPELLARATGMAATLAPTLELPDRSYGNLLLSRLPVEAVRRVDLSWRRREPRGVLDARLRTPAGVGLRCIATHLGLSHAERRHQHRLLRTVLDQAWALDEAWAVPTLLMGDFNEWRPLAPAIRALDRLFGPARALRTFPARLPLLPLDRIWAHPPGLLLEVTTWRSPLARRASDHLPVVARLRLPGAAEVSEVPTT